MDHNTQSKYVVGRVKPGVEGDGSSRWQHRHQGNIGTGKQIAKLEEDLIDTK